MNAASEPAPGRLTRRDRTSELAQLYEDHATGALRLAYLLTGDRQQAEDLVQDAFVRLIKRFRDKQDAQHLNAYLKRTVINLATSNRRRSAVERRVNSQQALERPPGPEIGTFEQQQSFVQSLRRLTPTQRLIVVLRIYEDLPEKEVSRMLNTTPAATRSALHRAVATLRQDLEGETHG